MFIRRLLAASAVAVLWSSTLVASPASAALSQCNSYNGWLCTWTSTGYSGTFAVSYPSYIGDCMTMATTARSAWNRTNYYVYWWTSSNCSGGEFESWGSNVRSDLSATARSFKFTTQ
ncbi:peptidase inhibitor family I36 protein [Plantactinospora sp. WMMB782]|uniref:peptidase inhibitor family I36 protein n=1 Tax=Plantactinospora sp. WMMB782 TaxID=3404121 RepID=UPI003B9382AF